MEDFIKDNLRKRIINTDGDYLMSDKLLIELLNKYYKEQLILNGVSNSRELLIGFAEYWDKKYYDDGDSITDDEVDNYLANL